jgi:hypothetical protein
MADEKRTNQIVDSNELSEKELEQAAGGVTMPAATHELEVDRAAVTRESGRRK